jgi:hypothetical protein
MASNHDSSSAPNDELRRLYEQYQAPESDGDRRAIFLEIGKLDSRRHADIYDALEDE